MPDPADNEKIVIEAVSPQIGGGRFPVQRMVGERVVVEADVFSDGPETLACRLLSRPESQAEWNETAMEALPEDRWRGEFTPTTEGRWLYTVAASAAGEPATRHPELAVRVGRERAGFSSWYELLDGSPREREARLDFLEEMSFDILCLGDLDPWEDSRWLVGAVRRRGMEVAVDLYPDGRDLKGVLDFWVRQGVTAFRVAAPGGVAFPAWERWTAEFPQVLFLAWDLAKPKITHRLAKVGFTQSRAEIPWSGGALEIRRVFDELAAARDFLRPCLWPNPPEHPVPPIEAGGRPVFVQRLILAATLGASYGVHQLRPWDLDPEDSLGELMGLVNRIRRENPALQSNAGLRFHATDNEQILCYSKTAGDNVLLMVVNLDPEFVQSAWVAFDPAGLSPGKLDLEPDRPVPMHDLLTGGHYRWHGSRNFVRLDPRQVPAHVFRVGRPAPRGS